MQISGIKCGARGGFSNEGAIRALPREAAGHTTYYMIYTEFIELLSEQLAESSLDCRAVVSLPEGLGLVAISFATFLHEAQQPILQQDPEKLLEALVRLASACARVGTDVVLPALDDNTADSVTKVPRQPRKH